MNFFKALTILFACLFMLHAHSQAQFRSGQTLFFQPASNQNLYLAGLNGGTSPQTKAAVMTKTRSNESSCKWKLEDAGGGWFFLRNVKSNLVLDVKLGRSRPGTIVWLYPLNRSDAQKFRFSPVPGEASRYFIMSKIGSGLRLDLSEKHPQSGVVVIVGSYESGRLLQKWKIASTIRAVTPSTPAAPGASLSINKTVFGGIANHFIRRMQIRLNNHGPRHRDSEGDVSWYKANDSYVRFEGYNSSFSLTEYSRGVRDKRSYINDMNLQSASARFYGEDLVLNLRFEEDGAEIKSYCSNCMKAREDNAAPDFQFENNRWEIRLKLVPYRGKIAYEVKSVKFLGTVDGRVFGEIWDGIVQRYMIPVFEQKMKQALDNRKAQISAMINDGLEEAGFDLPYVTSIRFSGKNIVFSGRAR